MADLARIKSNVAKMISMNAPEKDIDDYISGEGTSVGEVRGFNIETAPVEKKEPLIRSPFKLGATPQDYAQIGIDDIASGQLIPKAFNYIREEVKRPIMEKVNVSTESMSTKSMLPPIQAPVAPPTSPIDIGMKLAPQLAGLITPRAVVRGVAEIVTDPGTYLPTGPARKGAEKVGEGLAGLTKGAEEIAINVGEMPSKLARGMANIPSQAVKWIKQRGSEKIFDPLKEKPDYIKTYLFPQVKKVFDANTDEALVREGKEMGKAFSKIKANIMQFPNTFSRIKTVLNKNGLISENGRLIQGATTDIDVPPAMRILGKLYEETVEKNATRGKTLSSTPLIDKSRFAFYRSLLRKNAKSAGEFSGDVQRVIDGLYDDAEKAGAVGIKATRDKYRAINEAIEEVGVSPEGLAGKLQSATNIKEWQYLKEKFRPILKDKTDEIFNNIKDHATVQLFSKHGGGPIGLTKAVSQGVKLGLREHYEKGLSGLKK